VSQLDVELTDGRSVFAPGAIIAGVARWSLDAAPESVEVRLFWYTEGKGDQDVEVVDTAVADSPGLDGELPFSFTAPAAPPSFSGRLISLIWAVELVVEPGSAAARREILLSATGSEIRLDTAPPPEP
jgi:hypothetical protein